MAALQKRLHEAEERRDAHTATVRAAAPTPAPAPRPSQPPQSAPPFPGASLLEGSPAALEARAQARLVEESLSVRRLQQELSSVEECARLEKAELEQRVKVLTTAQATSKARISEQASRLDATLAELRLSKEHQKDLAVDAKTDKAELAELRAEVARLRAARERARAAGKQRDSAPPSPGERAFASAAVASAASSDAGGAASSRASPARRGSRPPAPPSPARPTALAQRLQETRGQLHSERKVSAARQAAVEAEAPTTPACRLRARRREGSGGGGDSGGPR